MSTTASTDHPVGTEDADDTEGVGDTGNGPGTSTSGDSSSTGEPPPIEVTVEGEVVDFVNMAAPIANADISVFDLPGVTAISDDMGEFNISPLPPDLPASFVVAPSTDYWGTIIPADIASDPLQEDVQLAQIPRPFIDLQIMYLEPQMPTMVDLDQAIVIVRLLNNTAVMEGDTIIDMTPAPLAGTFYAPDADGAPVLDQNVIQFSLLPVVVYFNIPDTAPGDISITATHPTRECTVLFPETPTISQHITLFDIECWPS